MYMDQTSFLGLNADEIYLLSFFVFFLYNLQFYTTVPFSIQYILQTIFVLFPV